MENKQIINYGDSEEVHNKLVNISSVSKAIKGKAYWSMTALILIRVLGVTTKVENSDHYKSIKAFKNRLNRKEKVATKLHKDYLKMKNDYLTLYDLIDGYLNIMLVNDQEPISYHTAVGHLYRHKLITKEEMNLLKLFNHYRNLFVHTLDASMIEYILEDSDHDYSDELLELVVGVHKFMADHDKKVLFKVMYLTTAHDDKLQSKVDIETAKKAVIDGQKAAGEEPLGVNLHLIKTK
jgi:uncharacterized protein YutE (UPF0331/DUF86 family)